jgi:hypothetical protein
MYNSHFSCGLFLKKISKPRNKNTTGAQKELCILQMRCFLNRLLFEQNFLFHLMLIKKF